MSSFLSISKCFAQIKRDLILNFGTENNIDFIDNRTKDLQIAREANFNMTNAR